MNFQVMAASPAANISPLEFRGWLQRHVAQMESPADGARVMLLVYITPPLRNALPAESLAAVVENLCVRNPALIKIEFFDTSDPMTPQQLQDVVDCATRDMAAAGTFSQFYGYSQPVEEGAPVDPQKVVCVVSNIVPGNRAMLQDKVGMEFPLGSWTVSSVSQVGIMVCGPFATQEKAKSFAAGECGANYFYKDLG